MRMMGSARIFSPATAAGKKSLAARANPISRARSRVSRDMEDPLMKPPAAYCEPLGNSQRDKAFLASSLALLLSAWSASIIVAMGG